MRLSEQKLSGADSFSFQGNNIFNSEKKGESAIRIKNVITLNTPALFNFLNKRSINAELAQRYCKEVHYSSNDKPYYAIGFQNNSGGWVLRSEYFKGCTTMDAKTFLNSENDKETLLLFEGFTDFLYYLTLKGERKQKQNTIVLNLVVNLPKVKNELNACRTLYAFLDNDEGGRKAVQDLRTICKDVQDMSVHYAKQKDLNDYLCSRSTFKSAMKKRIGRGLKM